MKQLRLARKAAGARALALIAASLAAASAPLWAQGSPAATPAATADVTAGLSLRDVAALALENDPAVRSSGALAMLAKIQYGLEIDRAAPKLTLGLTPFSWDDRRVVDFTATPPYVDAKTLGLGAGLSYAQALPSAGALNAGARANLRISDPFGGLGYSLAPQLNASLRQPLFAAGSLIPFRAASAARQSASLGADQAGLDDLARRNASVRAALEAAARVMNLRRALARQEAAVAAAERRAAGLELRRQAGAASEDAALELALGAQLARQALVDARASLRDAERRLAGALGLRAELAAGGGLALSEAIPAVARPAPGDIAANPELLKAELALRKASLDAQARSTVDAPSLGASLLVEPRYGDGRQPKADLASALSDFFSGDGSGVNWNLSLSLDLPLTAGRGRALRASADAEQAALAGAALSQARAAAEDRAAALAERRASMEERMAIQRSVVDLERRKLDRALALGAAGTATRDAAEDARLALAEAEDELFRMELELFILGIDEAALAGLELGAALGLR